MLAEAHANAVVLAAVSGWRAVCLAPERIKSVCRCEYLMQLQASGLLNRSEVVS